MKIPGYHDLTPLGRGGFSVVYRAVQESMEREVAVKVISVDIAGLDARAKFRREAATNGRVGAHPNIVTLYDSGFADDGSPYLAMQLCSGGSLTDKVRASGPLSVGDTLRIGVKVAAALHYAHTAGVLHRDIKPENILLTEFGEPELADFGIAAVDDHRMSTATAASFTISHAAPEALAGATPAPSADVYSLCSTLFTVLAGHPPFSSDNGSPAALMYKVLHDPAPTTGRDDAPEALEALLASGLSKTPAGRPESARALGTAMQEIQSDLGLPVTEFPSAPPPLTYSPTQLLVTPPVGEAGEAGGGVVGAAVAAVGGAGLGAAVAAAGAAGVAGANADGPLATGDLPPTGAVPAGAVNTDDLPPTGALPPGAVSTGDLLPTGAVPADPHRGGRLPDGGTGAAPAAGASLIAAASAAGASPAAEASPAAGAPSAAGPTAPLTSRSAGPRVAPAGSAAAAWAALGNDPGQSSGSGDVPTGSRRTPGSEDATPTALASTSPPSSEPAAGPTEGSWAPAAGGPALPPPAPFGGSIPRDPQPNPKVWWWVAAVVVVLLIGGGAIYLATRPSGGGAGTISSSSTAAGSPKPSTSSSARTSAPTGTGSSSSNAAAPAITSFASTNFANGQVTCPAAQGVVELKLAWKSTVATKAYLATDIGDQSAADIAGHTEVPVNPTSPATIGFDCSAASHTVTLTVVGPAASTSNVLTFNRVVPTTSSSSQTSSTATTPSTTPRSSTLISEIPSSSVASTAATSESSVPGTTAQTTESSRPAATPSSSSAGG